MTFSICVRERYTDAERIEQVRYGVAVTTRLATVGMLCPFINEHGAIATQSLVNVELGRKGVQYLRDGLAIDDALRALLNADAGSAKRQVHGVDRSKEFAHSGDESNDWYGHRIAEGYTVAGNLLTGADVVEETAEVYANTRDRDELLALRLVEALEAGYQAGGDRRTELSIQSAAVRVRSTENDEVPPSYNDIRVDATETPISDLRDTVELARRSYKQAHEREQ